VRALQSGLVAVGFFPADSLEDQLGEMSVQDSGAGGGTKGKRKKTGKDIKKWFDTCFEQIYKLATAFAATLAVVDDGNITLDAS
jgi:cyclin-D1-binding protein 1